MLAVLNNYPTNDHDFFAEKIPSESPDILSKSWVIGIDSMAWTPVGLSKKTASMRRSKADTFKVVLDASEPFRVRTEKGLALSRTSGLSIGKEDNEVFLKSVKNAPQMVNVIILRE